jgi:hypothetical protein
MSPASRRRKSQKKKSGKMVKTVRPTPPRSATPIRGPVLVIPDDSPAQTRRWWPASIEAILADAGQLAGAQGPRELEQATAELLGARLHHALETETAGFAMPDWLATLIEAAGNAGRERRDARDGDSRVPDGPWYLLHGITAIAPHPLARAAAKWFGRLGGPRAGDPEWLATTGAGGAVHGGTAAPRQLQDPVRRADPLPPARPGRRPCVRPRHRRVHPDHPAHRRRCVRRRGRGGAGLAETVGPSAAGAEPAPADPAYSSNCSRPASTWV